MSYMLETQIPDDPATVVVAVDHHGRRLRVARQLLRRDMFTLVLHGRGDVETLGGEAGPADPPRAVVASYRDADRVRRLLARVAELGWKDTTVFVLDAPDGVREEARRSGAVLLDGDYDPDVLARAIRERTAAA